jgi:hypothetical protein
MTPLALDALDALDSTASVIGSTGRCQLPLQNAFALTIHKVQGLSMSTITVSLDANMFSEGQAYPIGGGACMPQYFWWGTVPKRLGGEAPIIRQ